MPDEINVEILNAILRTAMEMQNRVCQIMTEAPRVRSRGKITPSFRDACGSLWLRAVDLRELCEHAGM